MDVPPEHQRVFRWLDGQMHNVQQYGHYLVYAVCHNLSSDTCRNAMKRYITAVKGLDGQFTKAGIPQSELLNKNLSDLEKASLESVDKLEIGQTEDTWKEIFTLEDFCISLNCRV